MSVVDKSPMFQRPSLPPWLVAREFEFIRHDSLNVLEFKPAAHSISVDSV
jgi:hypothetical protein